MHVNSALYGSAGLQDAHSDAVAAAQHPHSDAGFGWNAREHRSTLEGRMVAGKGVGGDADGAAGAEEAAVPSGGDVAIPTGRTPNANA